MENCLRMLDRYLKKGKNGIIVDRWNFNVEKLFQQNIPNTINIKLGVTLF